MLAHANAAPGTVALKNVVVFVLLFFFLNLQILVELTQDDITKGWTQW